MLFISLTKIARCLLAVLAFSLMGCGVTQDIVDGTKNALDGMFYKKITMLHLDFAAREELNTDISENKPLSTSVMVRIYQLKKNKEFEAAVYQQLLKDEGTILESDLLASRDVVIKPGGSVSINMPIEEETAFVAIVGWFRNPDMIKKTWKLVLRREDLRPDKPRIIEVGNNNLILRPL